MSDSTDPIVQIRLSDLLTLRAAVANPRSPPRVLALSAPAEPPLPSPAAEYLNTKAAAALLGVSPKCLETWRARGEGPPFAQLGRAVRYQAAALRAWAASKP